MGLMKKNKEEESNTKKNKKETWNKDQNDNNIKLDSHLQLEMTSDSTGKNEKPEEESKSTEKEATHKQQKSEVQCKSTEKEEIKIEAKKKNKPTMKKIS